MASKRPIKITILNRYYPGSITGQSAYELADYLETNSVNIDVSSVSVKSLYKGANQSSKISFSQKDIFISSFYHGNNKLLRLAANLYEGYSMVRKAISLKSDFVICMTDPPLLNFWASRLLKKEIPWFFWSMDLYPEAFDAAGLVTKNNIVYRYLSRVISQNPPTSLIALGQIQKKYLEAKFIENPKSTFVLPCGVHGELAGDDRPSWYDESKVTFAYAGNLGEAHSESFLKNFINSIEENKHQLILSIYGSKSSEILKMIEGRGNIIRVDMLYKNQFSYIDMHLVSLLPNWTNVCVPSKAISAICSGSPILFNGSENCDTYQILEKACFLIPYEESDVTEKQHIRKFLLEITDEKIKSLKLEADKIARELRSQKDATFREILNFIQQ